MSEEERLWKNWDMCTEVHVSVCMCVCVCVLDWWMKWCEATMQPCFSVKCGGAEWVTDIACLSGRGNPIITIFRYYSNRGATWGAAGFVSTSRNDHIYTSSTSFLFLHLSVFSFSSTIIILIMIIIYYVLLFIYLFFNSYFSPPLL